jgi:predicted HTH domain antitoxin
MITIKSFMEAIQYKVTEGSEYLWKCFGKNAYNLEHWNGKNDEGGVSVSIIFDTDTHVVYEMQAWDYSTHRSYRWIHPDYLERVKDECMNRGIDFENSLDDKKFIDLDVAEDILEKAGAMVAGRPYDTRIIVQVDLTEAEEVLIMKLAHEADMSLNKFVEHILQQQIYRDKAQP